MNRAREIYASIIDAYYKKDFNALMEQYRVLITTEGISPTSAFISMATDHLELYDRSENGVFHLSPSRIEDVRPKEPYMFRGFLYHICDVRKNVAVRIMPEGYKGWGKDWPVINNDTFTIRYVDVYTLEAVDKANALLDKITVYVRYMRRK